ncbi:protein O-GlcNAcase-like protein [Turdus rufiventris]|nr:protein O-GlcNAcase-like protein [Turdus rufiventris]
MAERPRFLCGVVEALGALAEISVSGHAKSLGDSLLSLNRLQRRGLNCYMYAPKDELKHRLLWREPYTEHEAACMRSLIEAAQEQGVEFIFAISAGQDMVFSSAGDRLLLQQKLRQVAAMGCRSFALLFDDIDPCMCQADRDVFPSLAQAQASVANEVYQELGQPSIFLFCPTEYCSSLCSPSPSQSCYLQTIGQELLPGIGVIWTGPKVVSQELSAVLLEEVEAVLRRCPVIWDNLYANDYDCRRVFLGPYMGRAPGLMSRLHGLLLNPNCELQANFIPIHTLGTWFQSELGSCAHPDQAEPGLPRLMSCSSSGMEEVAALGDSQGAQDGSYSPQEALELALHDWVAEINQQALEPAPLTLEEVRMLVELFYLPYQHGALAQELLEHFRWLRANSLSVGVPPTAPDACGGTRWRGRAQSFQLLCARTCRLHSRFVSTASRALLYDLHPYLWDIRNMLLAACAFVLWLDGHLLCDPDPKGTWGNCFGWCQSITAPILLGRDAEPWVRRGGLFGELQALLPVGNSCDLFYHPPPLFPSSQLYLLRPLLPLDKGELYRMCRESLDCDPKVAEILVAHPDLLGDRLLGSFLSLSPEYTFVLEDEAGPCGYAAGALHAEGFLQQRDSSWLPAIRHKYPPDLGTGGPALGQDALEEAVLFFHTEPLAVPQPVLRRFPSLVQLGTAPRVLDVGASRSLALCLLSALRANGSRGVFCQVSDADRQQLSFYSKLGFVALPGAWGSCPGAQLLGRLL